MLISRNVIDRHFAISVASLNKYFDKKSAES